jgi:hypothetical protein
MQPCCEIFDESLFPFTGGLRVYFQRNVGDNTNRNVSAMNSSDEVPAYPEPFGSNTIAQKRMGQFVRCND